jgi:hypothetical protein
LSIIQQQPRSTSELCLLPRRALALLLCCRVLLGQPHTHSAWQVRAVKQVRPLLLVLP